MPNRARLTRFKINWTTKPRADESRRDFFLRLAGGFTGYVPKAVYRELVELHDRVDHLEARLNEQR